MGSLLFYKDPIRSERVHFVFQGSNLFCKEVQLVLQGSNWFYKGPIGLQGTQIGFARRFIWFYMGPIGIQGSNWFTRVQMVLQ